jgi:hypothetical protein
VRGALRALAVLAALLGLALLGLALALPRIAASDAVRARLAEAARDATRRELSFTRLGAGLLPPRLELDEARLSGDAAGPAASAERIELRLALLPLLARAVVVRSLVVEDASLRLVRTEQGVRLAGDDLEEPPKPERPTEPAQPRSERAGFAFGVQRVKLRQGALEIADLTREPAPQLALRELEGELRASAPEDPVAVELRGVLASGGTLALRGEGRRDGPFEARIELGAVELAPFAPYAGALEVAARASGSVDVAREGAGPGRATLELRLDAERLAAADFAAHGPLGLHGELAGELRAPAGPFRIDASEGELRFGSALHKKAGVPAVVAGTLRRERGAGGVKLEGLTLEIGGIRASGEAELAPRRRLSLDAPPFDAGALEALLPGLAGRDLAGRLALAGLRVEADPLAVFGSLQLDPLGLGGLGAEHPVLRGTLEASGAEIVGRELRVRLAGEEAPLALRLADLAGSPKLHVAGRLEDADSSALIAALGGDRELLSGPLDLEADLRSPLGAKQEMLAGLRGDVSLHVAPGRLRNVSLLRSAFEATDAVRAARGEKDAKALGRHYGDEFESLSGRFRIRDGRARTDDLQLVYEGYTAALRGEVGLADRALDLHGELRVGEEVDAALGAGSGRARTIPLASVTGTLDEPRVALTREAIAGIAAAYAGDERRREKWEKRLDEKLGEGRGKDVLKALDQVLESLQKPPPESPPEGGAERAE